MKVRHILLITTAIVGYTPSVMAQTSDASSSPADRPAVSAPSSQAAQPALNDSSATAGIVVTGIRSSLRSAQKIKQTSDYQVDAIKAEDIGKFPDTNVAESLQRISGIAISRDNGEGQQITVRGLGPQFNTTLWNGRRLATETGGRSFDFDTLPSNLLGGTEVYKTTDVGLQEGAIGATVNLQTLRPLDLKPIQFVGSVSGIYDQQANKAEPQAFGLLSFKTKDERFGALIGVSYQHRKDVLQYADIPNYQPVGTAMNAADFAPGQTFDPKATYFAPQSFTNDIIREDRERLGINATIQFKPTDTLLLTVDGLYNRYTIKQDGIESAWYNNFSETVPGTAYADANHTITQYTYQGSPEFVKQNYDRPTKTYAIGGNLKWHPASNFTSTLDVSASHAKDSDGGKDGYFVIHGPSTNLTYNNRLGYNTPIAFDGNVAAYDSAAFPAGSPQLAAAPPVGSSWDRNSTTGYRSWFETQRGSDITDKIFEARLDNKWEVNRGILSAIRFGASYSHQSERNDLISADDVGFNNYGGTGIPLPASLFYTDNQPGFLSGANTPFTGKFMNFNGQALLNYLLSPEALALRDQLNGLPPGTSAAKILPRGYTPIFMPGQSTQVKESIFSAYAEARLKGDIGSLPFVATIGGRYTRTKTTSSSSQQNLLDLVPNVVVTENNFQSVFSDGLNPVSQTSKYGYFLPSANFRLDLTSKLLFRAAVSRTLTRPDLNQLNPVVAFPNSERPSNMVASGGNGDLKPYLAWNYDASLEWYLSPTTYVSVAGYYKDIQGYIVTSIVPETFNIANAAGVKTDFINGNQAIFNVTKSINLGSAKVYGLELSAQSSFTFLPSFLKYTGATVSVVIPKTNRNFDRTSFNNNNAFPGLSNSYYATVFYDDGKFELRGSWSRREKYFDGFATDTEPRYVESASYIDARIAYNFSSRSQVFANGVNLTNTDQKEVGRYSNQFLRLQQYGRRFEAGVRFKY